MIKTVKEADALYDSALAHYKKQKMNDALIDLKEILFIAKGDLRVRAFELLAKIFVDKSKIPTAIKFYITALKHCKEDNWGRKGILYNNLGILSQAIKDLDAALDYQMKCLEVLEKDGNQESIATTLRNLGRLYTLKGDHIKSLRSHQKSLKIKKSLGDNSGEALSLETMAQDLEFAENYADANAEYEKALTIYDKLGLHKDVKRMNVAIQRNKDVMSDKADYDSSEMYTMNTQNFI